MIKKEECGFIESTELFSFYEIDLTRDEIISMCPKWMSGTSTLIEGKGYSAMLRLMQRRIPNMQQRQCFYSTLSRSALYRAFRSGEHGKQICCEYRRIDKYGKLVWVHTTAVVSEGQNPGEIRAALYARNINEQKKRELALQFQAERDSLTGLYNRAAMQNKVNAQLSRKRERLCALFMLDIDNFKQINDNFGHVQGDEVLCSMARRLQSVLHRQDFAGRLGGDELTIFLGDLSCKQAAIERARRVCSVLRSSDIPCLEHLEISGSVGIAFAPEHGTSFAQLYQKADIALYHAKSRGKNQYAVFNNSLTMVMNARSASLGVSLAFSDHVAEEVFRILYYARELDQGVTSVLALLCKQLNLHHAYVCEYAPSIEGYQTIFEWVQPEETLWHVPGILANTKIMFDKNGFYFSQSLSQFKQAAKQNEPEIKSTLLYSTQGKSAFQGFIGVEDYFGYREFSDEERKILKISADIISTFLSGRRNEHQKEQYATALCTLLSMFN